MNATTKLMTIAAAALTLMALTSTSALAQSRPGRATSTTTTTRTTSTPRGSTTTTHTVRTPAPVVVKTKTVARAPQRPRRVLVAWQCPTRGRVTRTFYQTARPNVRRSSQCTPVYKPVRPGQPGYPYAARPGHNPHTVTVIRKG